MTSYCQCHFSARRKSDGFEQNSSFSLGLATLTYCAYVITGNRTRDVTAGTVIVV